MSSGACEACGWAAAICSMLAFGSFGVPIKSQAALSVDIDPLVFQSYKTFMCFTTSWLVLLAGEEFTFSPWGIVSGLFWVPGGVATIYAVKNAGLAIGIGIGSSFIVLVSFYWGIFVFDERVHSRVGASAAILSMILGLIGMSYFSSPESVTAIEEEEEVEAIPVLSMSDPNHNISQEDPNVVVPRRRPYSSPVEYQGLGSHDEEEDENDSEAAASGMQMLDSHLKHTGRTLKMAQSDSVTDSVVDEIVDDQDPSLVSSSSSSIVQGPVVNSPNVTVCGGVKVTKRQLGMLSAAFCGIWGGSIMAPMKWCKSDTKGTHYLISFAIGSAIVNTCLWLLRYLYNVSRYGSFSEGYNQLPSFHIKVMWLAGGTSGLLWSIGNFFSLISVFYLGEGVGYPLVQTSILVSGLWGIFYFKEVTGTERVSKWFLSSLLTIFGILLLSYEHHEK